MILRLSQNNYQFTVKHSYNLSSPGSNRNRKRKHGVYVRLPDDVKVARCQCKIAFDFHDGWFPRKNLRADTGVRAASGLSTQGDQKRRFVLLH